MKTPRYTDNDRYPHGYDGAAVTNIKRTFARIRAELKIERLQAEANILEAKAKVSDMKRARR